MYIYVIIKHQTNSIPFKVSSVPKDQTGPSNMSLRPRSKPAAGDGTGDNNTEALRVSPSPTLAQQALASAANLANLLPTGTLLAFQLLTPVFTADGTCDATTRLLTRGLLTLLAFSCALACFTDSCRLPDGRILHGLATPRGMWLIDEYGGGGAGDMAKYRIRPVDFVHAALSVLVFAAVAMRDKNVVGCFYPAPEKETREVLSILPLGVGVICSLLFVVFPTRRHGIGYPVTTGV